MIKAALVGLGDAWPQAVSFEDLLAQARAPLAHAAGHAENREVEARTLGEVLLKAYAGGLVELHHCPPRFASTPGERPLASALARAQAEQGTRVTNLRHYNIVVQDALGLALLRLLDGTRDRSALIDELSRLADSERAASESGDPGEGGAVREEITVKLEENLLSLGRMALLAA